MEAITQDGAFIRWLERRWLKRGNCLRHAMVLLAVPRKLEPMCEVCMGPVNDWQLHCWLECGNTVADLTSRPKFFSRSNYYKKYRIIESDVRRYSISDIHARAASGEPIMFWGFDLGKYGVK